MSELTLPDNYMIARFIYLKKELSKLPVVTRGVHHGVQVYRFKDHCYRFNTNNGKILEEFYQKRAGIISGIDELLSLFKGDLEKRSKEYKLSSDHSSFLDGEFFKNAEENASPYKNEYKYRHNGKRYRSRSEMMIAQVLTYMGLEFKYECRIVCGGKSYTADFLIYLPEFNRCIILEYLGMLDDEEYTLKNSRKIRDYLNKGIYFGRDIAFLCGNTYETPTLTQIYITICYLIEYTTSDCLININFPEISL
ncbi:MAG: hypothetical protein J5883_00370 [Clostridiales bacterium]|nr:hypothetical protein [Clostridiales bacterium]